MGHSWDSAPKRAQSLVPAPASGAEGHRFESYSIRQAQALGTVRELADRSTSAGRPDEAIAADSSASSS